MFELDAVLEKDSVWVGNFPLSQLRLINNRKAPWFILVPMREEVEEIHHLDESDRLQLMAESCLVAETIQDIFIPDKLNVAAIGNKVRQLHLHHVARYEQDECWPEPVWGNISSEPYTETELAEILQKVTGLLADELV
ncbi:HIT domain protein [Marinomonas gallaica]|uniref:HIT domain protein n=1 Tax=Marinomonas gallaica TaxID=1806667 RepID=A0A1C3JT93_9GAMM|nr:HIT domain-containing protein [Marinomonas gallaica]SBT18316.1 HIT domain protein [Marinomonas gallaica]SBT22366.1 HIT domain protein [Marinomonas gallaica]